MNEHESLREGTTITATTRRCVSCGMQLTPSTLDAVEIRADRSFVYYCLPCRERWLANVAHGGEQPTSDYYISKTRSGTMPIYEIVSCRYWATSETCPSLEQAEARLTAWCDGDPGAIHRARDAERQGIITENTP